MQNPITRIGFYHVDLDSEPQGLSRMELLRNMLATAQSRYVDGLSLSLIVLPEAFNFVGPYVSPNPGNSRWVDLNIESQLRDISREFSVAFVAGLIDAPLAQGANVAKLIDGDLCNTLHVKTKRDDSWAYRVDLPRAAGPLSHRGLLVESLICADAGGGRRDLADSRSVLCIPARFTPCGVGYDSRAIANHWFQFSPAVVVANGTIQPSVIRTRAGEKVFESDPIEFVDFPAGEAVR